MSTALGSFDFLMWSVGLSEGGYSNHPADHGGATKYGITQPFLDEYCATAGIPPIPVAKLTRDVARLAYFHLIWCGVWVRAREVSSIAPITGYVYADAAILHGRSLAARLLQRECGMASRDVDGKVGPATLTDLLSESRNRGDGAIAYGIMTRRRELIEDLVQDQPSQGVFLRGWRNRLNDVARRADLAWRWTYLPDDDAA